MEEKKVRTNKKITAKSKEHKGRIAFLSGRPKRENPITHDDLVNLEITLNTRVSIDDIIMGL